MNKVVKFILVTIFLILGRVYDVYSTSLYTPNLKNETNIVVKMFDAGWSSILIFQAIMLIAVIALYYYYLFNFRKVNPPKEDLSLKEYVSFFLFYQKDSFSKMFYKLPKNMNGFWAMTGYVATMTLIVASFIVGSSTTALLLSEEYAQFYKSGIPLLLYTIIILIALYFTIQFFRTNYRGYRQSLNVV